MESPERLVKLITRFSCRSVGNSISLILVRLSLSFSGGWLAGKYGKEKPTEGRVFWAQNIG